MPTSHRAPRRSAHLLRILAIVLAVVLVIAAAAYVGLGLLTGSGDESVGSSSATGPASPSASPSARTSPSPTRGPTTEPGTKKTKKATKRARKRTAPALTKAPASPPHAISIGRAIANAPFGNALSPTSGRLIPDAVDELQRLGDRGIPGSPGTDTVVLVGASSTSGRGALDGIDAVKRGESIVLETQDAKLTYRVTSTEDVAASSVLSLPVVTAKRTDRLVIDCAHYDNSQRTGADRVLVAKLVKAQPLRP
jgi:hypothetical protein